MKADQRLTISLTQEQYEYIRKIAEEKFEGKFSQSLRFLLNELIENRTTKKSG